MTDNGDVYFVPAFSGLYAPWWRADARGVIAGLTRYATAGHLARAALEATAYQTLDVIEAMQRDSGIPISTLRVDGGMVVNALLMQFQADILERSGGAPAHRRRRPRSVPPMRRASRSATGTSTDDLLRNWTVQHTWKPQMREEQRAKLIASWHKAVTRTFDWA